MLDTSHFLIQTLINEGVIQDEDVARSTSLASERGIDRIEALIEVGAVESDSLARTRAKICEYPYADLSAFDFDTDNARLLPRGIADRHGIFPLFIIDGVATVGMIDPLDLEGIDRARSHLKADVDPVVCDSKALRELIERSYGIASSGDVNTSTEVDEEDLLTGEEPIVVAVNQIIAGGIEASASDIHINPDDNELYLRYRVDGVLISRSAPPKAAHSGLVQRLKVLAHLDLAQTRRPQDGKFRFAYKTGTVDIRLSLIPTIHGENVVMRLLHSASKIGSIADLGMPVDILHNFEHAVDSEHGMILVTGPTGSGKTTTLYTAIARLNSPRRNIITIEDPVEIRLPLIRQVQVNPEVGLTFASALRSILRQDPDVILVGEIRDDETALIATQAALTGHVVLSTLHTNDAPGALARLRNFGVPGFAINNALLAVIAQRLVRCVCPTCERRSAHTENQLLAAGLTIADADSFVEGAGCNACMSTGFKGRQGVYEMIRITAEIQRLIESEAPIGEITQVALREDYRPLWHDALAKARGHTTTFKEFVRLRSTVENESASTQRNAA